MEFPPNDQFDVAITPPQVLKIRYVKRTNIIKINRCSQLCMYTYMYMHMWLEIIGKPVWFHTNNNMHLRIVMSTIILYFIIFRTNFWDVKITFFPGGHTPTPPSSKSCMTHWYVHMYIYVHVPSILLLPFSVKLADSETMVFWRVAYTFLTTASSFLDAFWLIPYVSETWMWLTKNKRMYSYRNIHPHQASPLTAIR